MVTCYRTKKNLFTNNSYFLDSLWPKANAKMIPLDVVSGGFNMVSNGLCLVIFSKGLEMFCFPVMEASLCFAEVKVIAVPGTGFQNNFRFLRAV